MKVGETCLAGAPVCLARIVVLHPLYLCGQCLGYPERVVRWPGRARHTAGAPIRRYIDIEEPHSRLFALLVRCSRFTRFVLRKQRKEPGFVVNGDTELLGFGEFRTSLLANDQVIEAFTHAAGNASAQLLKGFLSL